MLRTSTLVGAVALVGFWAPKTDAALGTVWVNFGGQTVSHHPNPNGNMNTGTTFEPFTLVDGGYQLFGPLTASDDAAVRSGILDALNQDYAGYGANFTMTMPTSGSFHTLVIGNPLGGDQTNVYGRTDSTDFRHRKDFHTVSVSASAHANHAVPPEGWNVQNVSQWIGNSASRELARSFGLFSSDVVSTYAEFVGPAYLRMAEVQNNEIMAANPNSTVFVPNPQFGKFSRIKLDVAAYGINVQTEVGNAVFVTPGSTDVGRFGEAGDTMAAAVPLQLDSSKRVTVVGKFDRGDLYDVFSFNANAGDRVTAEAISMTIAGAREDFVPMEQLNLALLDASGNILANLAPGGSNVNNGELDGVFPADTESRTLLYDFAIPSTGTYGIRIGGFGAVPNGTYEMFVMVPEPGAMSLLAAAAIPLLRRRRA